MSIPRNKELLDNARTLRKNMTKYENHLWYDFLRTYPVRFRRQEIIGNFIADFYCHKVKLIIEIDGTQHFTDEGKKADEFRTEQLEQYGLNVIRFTNRQINHQFKEVCDYIDLTVKHSLSQLR